MLDNPQVRSQLARAFDRSEVLITGGLGFIGSNLAIALVHLGARVTISDAMIPDYGGNLFNIRPVENCVTVNFNDVRDLNAMNHLVQGKDYLFHLAGQVCHVMSLTDPFPDIDINIRGTAVVMEACKKYNPRIKVIYTGTRGEYGSSDQLPVTEDAPTHPRGIYELSNLTAQKIIKIYNDVHGIRAVLLRLSNIYGPRAQMKHHRFGVANWFVRLAIDDQQIQVFGDGRMIRDFLYVDDTVEAILRSAVTEAAVGDLFNVGVDTPTNFIELAETIVRVAGTGRWDFAPFSPERKALEPGDFYSDISKIGRVVGWTPSTTLEEGMRRTVDYYRRHRGHYW